MEQNNILIEYLQDAVTELVDADNEKFKNFCRRIGEQVSKVSKIASTSKEDWCNLRRQKQLDFVTKLECVLMSLNSIREEFYGLPETFEYLDYKEYKVYSQLQQISASIDKILKKPYTQQDVCDVVCDIVKMDMPMFHGESMLSNIVECAFRAWKDCQHQQKYGIRYCDYVELSNHYVEPNPNEIQYISDLVAIISQIRQKATTIKSCVNSIVEKMISLSAERYCDSYPKNLVAVYEQDRSRFQANVNFYIRLLKSDIKQEADDKQYELYKILKDMRKITVNKLSSKFSHICAKHDWNLNSLDFLIDLYSQHPLYKQLVGFHLTLAFYDFIERWMRKIENENPEYKDPKTPQINYFIEGDNIGTIIGVNNSTVKEIENECNNKWR